MRYVTAGEVVAINEAEIGPGLLADFGLLESAVLRAQQSVFGADAYPDIHSKAAALLHSLIRNHPFIDGNKRTAVLSVLVFYELNGYWVEAEQDEPADRTRLPGRCETERDSTRRERTRWAAHALKTWRTSAFPLLDHQG